MELRFLILSSPCISLHAFPHNRPVMCQLTHTLANLPTLILLQNYSNFITEGEIEVQKDKERGKEPCPTSEMALQKIDGTFPVLADTRLIKIIHMNYFRILTTGHY